MENMELLQAIQQMIEQNNRQLLDRMDARFEKIDERLDKMDERLDKMDDRLDKMDDRLDKIDERLDKVDERLDKIEDRLDKVETLATKTQIAIENDITPKIKLLFEGQIGLRNRFAQLDEMERILRQVRSDVQDLQRIVSWHTGDIKLLKRRRNFNKS